LKIRNHGGDLSLRIAGETILLISVKGMSMGTPIATRPGVGGTMTIVAGDGQQGLVSTGGLRLDAERQRLRIDAWLRCNCRRLTACRPAAWKSPAS
jgi:hypothetical protein